VRPEPATAPGPGYDAETGKLVATSLGVEPCFVTTPFDSMIAGRWGDRFDVAWASGAITSSRLEKLYVTQPYYSTPASFFVAADAAVTKPEELSGKQIGACAGCTHELYLRRTLELPGAALDWLVDDPKIVTYNTEPPGLVAVAGGDIDAFLCSEPVGLAAIKDGAKLRSSTHRRSSPRRPATSTEPHARARRVRQPDQRGGPGPARQGQAQGAVRQVLRNRLRDPGRAVRPREGRPDGSLAA
jgi:hypothetical protein